MQVSHPLSWIHQLVGKLIMVNFHRRTIMYRMSCKSRVSTIAFSPCGKFFALALEKKNTLQIWRTPSFNSSTPNFQFAPFVLHRQQTGHGDTILKITWSSGSDSLLTSSKDRTVRLFTVDHLEAWQPLVLTAHRDSVLGAWWSENNHFVYSVTKNGTLFVWIATPLPSDSKQMSDGATATPETTPSLPSSANTSQSKLDEDAFVLGKSQLQLAFKLHFNQSSPTGGFARVSAVLFHRHSSLLVVGFSTGVFGLWDLSAVTHCLGSVVAESDVAELYRLSISQNKINSIAISPLGDWISFASSEMGQLLVWEWQSESYIMKQQSHAQSTSCVAYSADGNYLATGGEDGKLKVWECASGFCFVTFTEHSGPISALVFSQGQSGRSQVLVSASADGTIRAFDLMRYRNFRTFTSPQPVVFSALAVDAAGEIVCGAGGLDDFSIYVWNMRTGALVDVLSGHEGPVSSLAFPATPTSDATILASGSWDKTVRVWDLFARGAVGKCLDVFAHQTVVLTVAIRADGRELCAGTLGGKLMIWDPVKGGGAAGSGGNRLGRISEIDIRGDLYGGRHSGDPRLLSTQKKMSQFHATSIAYTPDGEYLMAAGTSMFVCLYDLSGGKLLKRYPLSSNLDIAGTRRSKLNSKLVARAEAGGGAPLEALSADFDLSDDDEVHDKKLSALVLRRQRTILDEAKMIRMCPTGRGWSVAVGSLGAMVFHVREGMIFDPLDLDIDVTPNAIIKMVEELQALSSTPPALRQPPPTTTSDDLVVDSMATNESDHDASWLTALLMAFRLNEPALIQFVYESISPAEISLLARSMPRMYLDKTLKLIASLMDNPSSSSTTPTTNSLSYRNSPHLEFHLLFLNELLSVHGRYLREHGRLSKALTRTMQDASWLESTSLSVILRAVKKNLMVSKEDLSKLFRDNLYALHYFCQRLTTSLKRARTESIDIDAASISLPSIL